VRTVLILSAALMVFGCKKASSPDPLDADKAAVGDADGAEVEDLEPDETGGKGKKGGANNAGANASAGAGAGAGAGADASAGAGAEAGAGAGAGADNAGGGGGGSTTAPGDPNPTQPGAPAGNVEFIIQSVAGGTAGDAVKAALEKSKQRYRGCYGKALGSDSSTAGVLKLRATIATDGAVDKVEVIGGNLGLSPLVQCSVAATKGLKIVGAAAPATKASFDVKFSK
jgi:hypothetical protein